MTFSLPIAFTVSDSGNQILLVIVTQQPLPQFCAVTSKANEPL